RALLLRHARGAAHEPGDLRLPGDRTGRRRRRRSRRAEGHAAGRRGRHGAPRRARRAGGPALTAERNDSMENPPVSRRAFLRRASVVTLALGALPRPTAAAQSMSMRLGWLANAQYAGDYVALDKGWFKERGIELKIDPGGPSIDPVSLTAAGSN